MKLEQKEIPAEEARPCWTPAPRTLGDHHLEWVVDEIHLSSREPVNLSGDLCPAASQRVFEKGRWLHGHRLMSVAVAAMMMRVSETAVSCS